MPSPLKRAMFFVSRRCRGKIRGGTRRKIVADSSYTGIKVWILGGEWGLQLTLTSLLSKKGRLRNMGYGFCWNTAFGWLQGDTESVAVATNSKLRTLKDAVQKRRLAVVPQEDPTLNTHWSRKNDGSGGQIDAWWCSAPGRCSPAKVAVDSRKILGADHEQVTIELVIEFPQGRRIFSTGILQYPLPLLRRHWKIWQKGSRDRDVAQGNHGRRREGIRGRGQEQLGSLMTGRPTCMRCANIGKVDKRREDHQGCYRLE